MPRDRDIYQFNHLQQKNKIICKRQNKYLLHQNKHYLENRNLVFNPAKTATLDLSGHPWMTLLLCLSILELAHRAEAKEHKKEHVKHSKQQCPINPSNGTQVSSEYKTTFPSQSVFTPRPQFNYPNQETTRLLGKRYHITGNLTQAEFVFWGEQHNNILHHEDQIKFMPLLTKPGDYLLLESMAAMEPAIECRNVQGAFFSDDLICLGWDYVKGLGKKYNSIFGNYFYQKMLENTAETLKFLELYNKRFLKHMNNPFLSKNEIDQLMIHVKKNKLSNQSFRNFCEKTLKLGSKYLYYLTHPYSADYFSRFIGYNLFTHKLFGEKNLLAFEKEVVEFTKDIPNKEENIRRHYNLAETLKKLHCNKKNPEKKCPRKVIIMGRYHLPDDDKDMNNLYPERPETLEYLKKTVAEFDTCILRPKKS